MSAQHSNRGDGTVAMLSSEKLAAVGEKETAPEEMCVGCLTWSVDSSEQKGWQREGI